MAIVLAVLGGDLVLAVGFGQLLRHASGRCLPAVDLENNWAKPYPNPARTRLSV